MILPLSLSVSLSSLSVCMSISLPTYCIYLSIICLIYHLSYLPNYPPTTSICHLAQHLSIYPSISLFVCLPICEYLPTYVSGFLCGSASKESSWVSLLMGETSVQSLGWEDLLEKGKATHSSILAWRTPWTV